MFHTAYNRKIHAIRSDLMISTLPSTLIQLVVIYATVPFETFVHLVIDNLRIRDTFGNEIYFRTSELELRCVFYRNGPNSPLYWTDTIPFSILTEQMLRDKLLAHDKLLGHFLCFRACAEIEEWLRDVNICS
jgi:hypothetical protein